MDTVGAPWYVLRVIPGQEGPVSIRLARLGLEHYLPLRTVHSIHKRYRSKLERSFPVFSGYIFTVAPRDWHAVRELEGAIGYLELSDRPERIDFEEIAKIKVACDMGDYNSLEALVKKFAANNRVSPLAGPMFGKVGTVLSMKGNNALRVMFDKATRPITMPVDMVELVG